MKRENKLILEFTEFNIMRFNSDNTPTGSPIVDNPGLSLNAFDKHQDAIRQAISRIDDILGNVKTSTAYSDLRSKLGLEDQDITGIKILRIIKDQVRFDVYLKLTIQDQEYWGKIHDIIGPGIEFTSELFKDYSLSQPKEWIIKTKGLVIKTVKKWLKPEYGIYRLLNDDVFCYSVETGKQLIMKSGIEIELIRAYNDRILIKYDSDYYNLIGDNYVYFNWWFEKIDETSQK